MHHPSPEHPSATDLLLTTFLGRLGWTYHTAEYPLPERLPDHAPVRIISVVDEKFLIRVQDTAGAVWTLFYWMVDFPNTYHFPGDRRTYTEFHPRVRSLIHQSLERILASTATGDLAHPREETIRHLQWQLDRSANAHPLAGQATPLALAAAGHAHPR